MAVFVIADLHLNNSTPELLDGFTSFVSKLKEGDELYIIGDLFNFFVGLDKGDKAQNVVACELYKAKDRGILSYFIKGNRDFLMTKAQAQKLGLTLLNDISVINRYGFKIILSHGDMFCTNDLAYQKYYKLVNNRCLQRLFRMLPLFIRRKIASSIREQSKEANYHRRDPAVYGIVPQSIEILAQKVVANITSEPTPKTLVVHGHIHDFSYFQNESSSISTRYVLGSWGKSFSYWAINEVGMIVFKQIDLSDISKIDNFLCDSQQ